MARRKLLIASLSESASVRGDRRFCDICGIRDLNSTFGTRPFLYRMWNIIVPVGGHVISIYGMNKLGDNM